MIGKCVHQGEIGLWFIHFPKPTLESMFVKKDQVRNLHCRIIAYKSIKFTKRRYKKTPPQVVPI